MFKNYILISWRSLVKNSLFSFINIAGLALSMSVCMIVLIRIMDGLSYDNFHHQPDRIYRIISEIESEQGKWTMASTPLPLADALLKDNLTFENITNLYPSIYDHAQDGSQEFEIRGAFTQPSFFKLFGFSLKYGDAVSALVEPNSLVLSQATSEKFYGDANPVGKVITLRNLGTFQITGVLKPPPGKSHITYGVFASASSVMQLEKDGKLPKKYEQWDSFENGYTYVKLRADASEEAFIKLLANLSSEINKSAEKGAFFFEPQPLSSITPSKSDIIHEISRGPSRGSLMAEVGIVLIILVSACFNYTNLSIARALTRGKEVGIRKLSGAQRWQIFVQYITESVIIAFLALCIANIILGFILEYKPFNDGYEMVPSVAFNFQLMIVFIVFTVVAGIMAGAIPAWILSAFKPARILRNVGSEKLMGNLSLRKSLIVFQFALSLVILVFLSAFYNQFDFLAKAETGFNRENILLMPITENKDIVASAFEGISGVKRIAFISNPFGSGPSGTIKASIQRNDHEALSINYYYCDGTLVNLMGLELVEGNNFNTSLNAEQDVLLNEKAVQALGFKNPASAVGAAIYFQDTIPVRIRGVVRDFYDQGYGNLIQPTALRNISSGYKYMEIEVEATAQTTIVSRLEKEWKKIQPDNVFTYSWLDKKLDEGNEQSAENSMLGFLGFMTTSIACMGLLGLVVYTVETRRKEVSVRKIVGASVRQLIILLSGGFVKLLILSGVIALPIGFILSEMFLMNFANRVPFGIGDLMLCFGLLLAIGLVTILSQTYKASTENPAKNLRSE